MKKGRVHIYAGNGKGKSTAAVGLSVRAAASGKKVLFVQFLKDGSSAEIKTLRNLEGIQVITGQLFSKFSNRMSEEEKEETLKLHEAYFEQVLDILASEQIDLLVLDEAFGAISTAMLDPQAVLNLIDQRAEGLELVLTGRDPGPDFIQRADYYTEMNCHKHPFESEKLGARKGIEY